MFNKYNLYLIRKKYFPKSIKTLEKGQVAPKDGVVTIPSDIEEIANNCFENCNAKKVVFPKSIKAIEMFSFAGCNKLEELVFEDSTNLVRINTEAFKDCTNLKRITDLKIGKENTINVKHICSRAFANCTSLKELTLNNLEGLSYLVFEGCLKLEVYLPCTLKNLILTDSKEKANKTNCTFVIDKDNKYLQEKLNKHNCVWRYKD